MAMAFRVHHGGELPPQKGGSDIKGTRKCQTFEWRSCPCSHVCIERRREIPFLRTPVTEVIYIRVMLCYRPISRRHQIAKDTLPYTP